MTQPEDLKSITETKTYVMIRRVAAGGMGTVYEARQFGAEGFEKTVAIKTILESLSRNPEFLRMFIGEAKLVADLVHEHIVQVYHLGKTDNTYYMALEFVNGINLEQLMDDQAARGLLLPIELGAYIISRVCRGLEYAHNKRDRAGVLLGIVHRDVSPKNILLAYEGVVKLTDFGIAKARLVMEQKEGEVLMGKVEYMSPEQARYEETDRRSDLFSLGIVLYNLLTGQHLFASDNIARTLLNVTQQPIPHPQEFRRELPALLGDILLRALQRDVARRYQTAGEMGVALEYFLYHKGYGPTIVTLGNYLKRHFLGESPEALDPERVAGLAVTPGAAALPGEMLPKPLCNRPGA